MQCQAGKFPKKKRNGKKEQVHDAHHKWCVCIINEGTSKEINGKRFRMLIGNAVRADGNGEE
jgi:hypothetical protein